MSTPHTPAAPAGGAPPTAPGLRAHAGRLLALLRPYRGRWALATLALVIGGLTNLVLPQPVRLAIDEAVATGDLGALGTYAALAIGGFFLLAVATVFRHYLMSWLGNRVVSDLRRQTFAHLLRFPPGWFHDRRAGELVSRLTDDIGAIQTTVGSELSMALRSSLTAVGALIMLVATSPALAALALVMVPPLSILSVRIGRRIRRQARAMQDALAGANASLKEAISAIETVQVFGAEPFEAGRYGERIEASFRASNRVALSRGLFVGIVEFAAFGVVTALLYLGARQVTGGDLTAGAMTTFLIYTLMVATSLATLANLWGNLQRAMGASERVFELLDEAPAIADPAEPAPLPDGARRGMFAFEAVGFRYPGRPDVAVLDGISFEASPGEVIALVGRSGAGKSTIAALLQRFWDPTAGRVAVGGVDVRTLRLGELRRGIATVAQDPVLFSGTLRDNILYGRPDASEAELMAAVRDANLEGFVARLPEGLETVVGERGVKVSGGERQRVAIARAILADPAILILDEATSHLDGESERLVQGALDRLMENRTTLVIAHRLSTIRGASQILVLDGGRIVQRGRHDELIAAPGIYAELQRLSLSEGAASRPPREE
jgi:ATP-binding cassette subfamily B protein